MIKTTQTFLFLSLFFIMACNKPKDTGYLEILGDTMGSSYFVKYKGAIDYSAQIDSILISFNSLLSTYDSASFLSRFNRNELQKNDLESLTEQQRKWMLRLYKQSMVLYHKTQGAFNPAVGPLLSYWGFGDNRKHPESVDSLEVNRLIVLSEFDKINLRWDFLYKGASPDMTVNFNAIAAGFATDIVAEFFDSHKVEHYLINITGENKAKGINPKGEVWLIEIEKPTDTKSAKQNPAYMQYRLNDKAMATSGNYRSFFELNGTKYAHTIDPRTGFPSQSSLLSATVISKYGAACDALATAFMVMGYDEAKAMVEADASLDAVLIWNDNGEMRSWVSWEQE